MTAADRAEDSIAMARLVFGGADFLEEHCVIQGNINVNSPVVFDGVTSLRSDELSNPTTTPPSTACCGWTPPSPRVPAAVPSSTNMGG